ncbi:unnamed protein product [Caenorhabditis sp. 36 PRJEB53466]|nr:unnamed protein product [Caenorhabditis sp. 36 PRJEB53466]
MSAGVATFSLLSLDSVIKYCSFRKRRDLAQSIPSLRKRNIPFILESVSIENDWIKKNKYWFYVNDSQFILESIEPMFYTFSAVECKKIEFVSKETIEKLVEQFVTWLLNRRGTFVRVLEFRIPQLYALAHSHFYVLKFPIEMVSFSLKLTKPRKLDKEVCERVSKMDTCFFEGFTNLNAKEVEIDTGRHEDMRLLQLQHSLLMISEEKSTLATFVEYCKKLLSGNHSIGSYYMSDVELDEESDDAENAIWERIRTTFGIERNESQSVHISDSAELIVSCDFSNSCSAEIMSRELKNT